MPGYTPPGICLPYTPWVHPAHPLVYTAALVLHSTVGVRADGALGSRRENSLGGGLPLS